MASTEVIWWHLAGRWPGTLTGTVERLSSAAALTWSAYLGLLHHGTHGAAGHLWQLGALSTSNPIKLYWSKTWEVQEVFCFIPLTKQVTKTRPGLQRGNLNTTSEKEPRICNQNESTTEPVVTPFTVMCLGYILTGQLVCSVDCIVSSLTTTQQGQTHVMCRFCTTFRPRLPGARKAMLQKSAGSSGRVSR